MNKSHFLCFEERVVDVFIENEKRLSQWLHLGGTGCRWGSEQVDLTVWILKLTLLYLINYP
jgi:hypothetical protein